MEFFKSFKHLHANLHINTYLPSVHSTSDIFVKVRFPVLVLAKRNKIILHTL